MAMWKKLACVGLIGAALAFAGCGSEHKVAVIDYQKLEASSPKIQSIEKEISDKDKEIRDRLNQDSQSGLSDEDMQKKVQSAQQERMIFIQSKQKQIQSMVESQAAQIAKEKAPFHDLLEIQSQYPRRRRDGGYGESYSQYHQVGGNRMAMWKKLACVGLIGAALAFAGCGSEHKVAVIDYQKLEASSPKIQSIEKEISDKDKEIRDRLNQDSQSGLSDEDMQKKVQSAQQERMIFIQSKQKQIQSMVESQAAQIAKEKGIGIVMHKRAVPSGAVDITDEVMAKIDGTAKAASSAASSASK